MDKSSAVTGEAAPLIPYGIPALPPFQEALNPPPQPYLLLPLYRRRRRHRICCRCSSSSFLLLSSIALLLLLAAFFFLWPSDPAVQLVRLRLDHVRVITSPAPLLDVSMDLRARVRNVNFFSLDYDSLVVSIAYRGRRLGFMNSGGGRIRARGVSYVDARLRLDGIRVMSDVFYLIKDLARGSIPFDTVTEVDGKLRVFFVNIPIEGKISCVVSVDPGNQTVVHQDCYPE